MTLPLSGKPTDVDAQITHFVQLDRPLWAKASADGEDLLKTKRLSPLQREAVENDLQRYRNVVRRTLLSK